MTRQPGEASIKMLRRHTEWLLANGYKHQASSCKRQIRMILKKQQASSDKQQALDTVGFSGKKIIESEK